MHASNDTGHHDAGYSYDTGYQTVFPSYRQLSKAALFILIYDKDLSSGCTLHAEKKLCISFSFTLFCSISLINSMSPFNVSSVSTAPRPCASFRKKNY